MNIYGMAKSYLDLRGSKARGFELDFLRLAIAQERDPNCLAVYLCAPLPEKMGVSRVNEWNSKYNARVHFVPVTLKADERRLLEAEKNANQNSNRAGGANNGAEASFGGKLLEAKLTDWIKGKHPQIRPENSQTSSIMPGIRWDYFGSVQS